MAPGYPAFVSAHVSTTVLLQHMLGMKSDLQAQIDRIGKKMDEGFAEMRQGFKEAREHREALQEDLYATMRVQHKHSKKLARL